MSILVDTNTKLCVSGITGREGTFHSLRNRAYGTQVVGGVTPGKGGQDVEGIPVFNTFHDAVEVQRVLDAARLSDSSGAWEEVESSRIPTRPGTS